MWYDAAAVTESWRVCVCVCAWERLRAICGSQGAVVDVEEGSDEFAFVAKEFKEGPGDDGTGRVIDFPNKVSARAKLAALGLTEAEITALLGA